MDDRGLCEWVRLNRFLVDRPHARRWLLTEMGGYKTLETLGFDAIRRRLSLNCPETGDIFSADYPDWADKEIDTAGKAGFSIVTYNGPDYPPGLRRLFDPPALLYVRGCLLPGDADAVAVVGARRGTHYGLRAAEELAGGLALMGVTVISGLALGADAAAHRGALKARGRTVAVLGSGIDVCYPRENAGLFESIPAAGAVVSEYPLGTRSLPHHFPARNRIIAGLSEAVVVAEAARDSGSLITAGIGLELGIVVGAIPGSIYSRTSEGCNDLIHDGAVPVRGPRDIVEQLPISTRRRAGVESLLLAAEGADAPKAPGLHKQAARVLSALSPDVPRGPEELASSLRLASEALLGHLLELEILGLAVRVPGDRYLRK